jgi:hypothetical protein
LIVELIAFSQYIGWPYKTNTPSKRNTISHPNGHDSYQITFLKDSSQAVPRELGGARNVAGMEDHGDQH